MTVLSGECVITRMKSKLHGFDTSRLANLQKKAYQGSLIIPQMTKIRLIISGQCYECGETAHIIWQIIKTEFLGGWPTDYTAYCPSFKTPKLGD